jgi:hypothetical protein
MSYTRVGAAVLAAVVVAGCGGGTTWVTLSAPTKANAEAAGAAINLTSADVPSGYTGAAHDSTDDNSDDSKAFAACTGATPPGDALADVYSEDFSEGAQLNMRQVSSEVVVLADRSRATMDLKAYQGSKTEACLNTFVGKLLTAQTAGSGVTFGPPTVAKLTTDPSGTDGGFGYIVTTTASAAGVEIPFEIAVSGFLVKHTGVQLSTLSVGGPFPANVRTDLLAKLATRAKAKAV